MTRKQFFALFLSSILCGCTQEGPKAPELTPKEKRHAEISQFLERANMKLPSYFSLERLKRYVEENDLAGASRYVNMALNVNVKNPYLHLINGLVYEEMQARGDNSKNELAGIAYRSAYSLDTSQWLSAYLLGVHELNAQRYAEAQKHLADALSIKPNDPDTLYSLAFASYYLQDLPVALSSIARAATLNPKNPQVNRTAAIIFAAGGQINKAKRYLNVLKDLLGKDHPEIASVHQRIEDWRNTHSAAVSRQTVESGLEGLPSRAGEALQDIQPVLQKQQAAKSTPDAPSVVLDCYFLRTVEDATIRRGQNLMDSLQVSLGTSGQAISSISRTISRGIYAPPASQWTKTFAYELNPYALEYNLNIANSSELTVTVNSRPTISTVLQNGAQSTMPR